MMRQPANLGKSQDPLLCDVQQHSLLSLSGSTEPPVTWWENIHQAALQDGIAVYHVGQYI